jgi:glycosyltransferase involved in cell wall biosynthesis
VKLKVLHLVKTSIGARWAFLQMRELVKLGVEAHVALPPGGPLAPEYEAAGITIHPLQLDFPIRNPWRCPKVFGELRNLVSRVGPDIIHSHFVGTTLTMRLALGKTHPIPRIFQVPGPLHLEHPFFRWAEILTGGRLDYWIGSCKWTCERYRKSGISQDRLFLSYYGTDLDSFNRCEKGKLRKELGIEANIKIVGMVAFMYPPKWFLGQTRGLKGHEDLIDALAICLKTEPNIIGVFIGGAWPHHAVAYENRVRAYGRKRCGGRAIFLGTRNDVPELYPDLDVVVSPSHSENVGAGAVESLFCAVSTIATNVGGFPDLVRQGETGWLVPPRAPAQLAETILEALRDPVRSHRMAVRGQSLAKQLFDVKETARQVSEIYNEIIDQLT